MKSKNLNFLILSNLPQHYLQQAIENAGHTWERIEPRALSMYISDEHGKDEIWLNGEPLEQKKFDVVIPRLHKDRAHGSRVLRHMAENLGAYCLQSGRAVDLVSDKFRTAQLLASKGIRVIKQFLCKTIDEDFDAIIEKLGGYPVIAKPVGGSQGKGIILLESPLSARHIIEYLLLEAKTAFLLQSFVETRTEKTGGTDLRLVLCNGKVISCMKRTAPAGSIKANLSINAVGEKYTPSKEILKMAVDAVDAVEGLTMAGIDIIVCNKTNKPYLVEINSAFGSKIVKVLNYNHWIDIVAFAANEAPKYRRSWEASEAEKREAQASNQQMKELVTACANDLQQARNSGADMKYAKRHFFDKYGPVVFDQALNEIDQRAAIKNNDPFSFIYDKIVHWKDLGYEHEIDKRAAELVPVYGKKVVDEALAMYAKMKKRKKETGLYI